MRSSPFAFAFAFAFAAASATGLPAGCGGASPAALHEPDGYDGCATDESWRTFDERQRGGQVTVDDAQAVQLQAPLVDGATLPATPVPTLAWQVSKTVVGAPGGSATCSASCGPATPAALGIDHCLPVSGDVFDLQFSVAGAVVYRVLTTTQTFTPPKAVWASWRGHEVSLVTVRMQLKVNDVQDGPYRASRPLTFRVGS